MWQTARKIGSCFYRLFGTAGRPKGAESAIRTAKSGVKKPRKLSSADKQQIEAAIRKAKGADERFLSAQQSIPYERIWPEGICRVKDNFYTKTILFQDINYQLCQQEDKQAIIGGWCDFLNYFDNSVKVQLGFLNLPLLGGAHRQIRLETQEPEYEEVCLEYSEVLQRQQAKGNNGLDKSKFITFGIEAENLKEAKPRLERLELDILNNFRHLGVAAQPLSGRERLEQLYNIFHQAAEHKAAFRFNWDWLPASGLSSKDFVAPSSFEYSGSQWFRQGNLFGAVSFVQILAPELNDRMLADFLDMDSSQIVSLHIQPIDQTAAIKQVKRKITDLDRQKIEEQKRAVRSGYDMDIIPSDLAAYGLEAKKLLEDLQSRNERMFLVTFLVTNIANSKRQLENDVFQTAGVAQKHNCRLVRLDWQQEQGFMSCLPLGYRQVEIERGLTTGSAAILVPFTTQELYQERPEALYYGLNALSNNLIMADRKQLKNPNGLILGTPGSGKSFAAKREILNVFLATADDILICDPEAEYYPLVERLGGQVVKISPVSRQYVNPLDLNLNYSDDENPLSLKVDFILSFCDVIIGSKDSLQPIEKTVIDRCVRAIYRDFLVEPTPEKMPILEDLYKELLQQPESEARRIAAALELYVSGSLNVFNHRTNVDINKRIVC